MEGFLTFIIIFVAVIWLLGKVFPRILLWYLQRKMKQGGSNGFSGGSFGNNGFASFWSNASGFSGAGFNNAQQQNSGVDEVVRESKREEGKVIIENRKEDKEKVIDRSMGEYVDFEEDKN